MKVAVASEDGSSISHHFGRSQCFLVFEIENDQVVGQTLRENRFTAHALGECHGGHEGQEHPHHGHGAIVEALRDCAAVLCYGMGWRAAEALKQSGIKPLVVPGEMSPADAVKAYLGGNLGESGGFCRCHH